MNRVQQRVILVLLSIVVFLLIATYFFAMFLGPTLLFFTSAGLNFSSSSIQPPILLFLLFGFYAPFTLTAGQLFVFIWSFFVLCFILAWTLRESFFKVFRELFSGSISKIFNNSLFALPLIASALFTVVFYVINLQDVAGIPTGSLPMPTSPAQYFDQYISVSYAPIVEEIGFRIVPIGVLLFVYLFLVKSFENTVSMSFWKRVKLFLFSFLYPDGAKAMIGQKNVAKNGLGGISKGEWILVLITSLVFGLAHIISGIGWEVGKVTSTFIQGFVFAIVYLAYGFEAPILMHWFFNYYFYTYYLSAQYYPSIINIPDWIQNVTLAIGLPSLIAFTVMGLMKILHSKKTGESMPKSIPIA